MKFIGNNTYDAFNVNYQLQKQKLSGKPVWQSTNGQRRIFFDARKNNWIIQGPSKRLMPTQTANLRGRRLQGSRKNGTKAPAPSKPPKPSGDVSKPRPGSPSEQLQNVTIPKTVEDLIRLGSVPPFSTSWQDSLDSNSPKLVARITCSVEPPTKDPTLEPTKTPLFPGQTHKPTKEPTRTPLEPGQTHKPTKEPTKTPLEPGQTH